jgi:hypothetical protein
MKRYENRVSLPAMAIAAVVALSVTGGTAALFQSKTGVAEPSVYTLAASKQVTTVALPMREVVPNRVEVIAVREPERVSGFFQRVARKLGG